MSILGDINSDVLDEYNFHMPIPEEVEQRNRERALELEQKGFLPENEGYRETMHSSQEEVENNPEQYIIQECLPACQELWKKNIYTFMVSDHLNEGVCWVEVVADSLSEENIDVYMQLTNDEAIKFSYHEGTLNFGVRSVGIEGQQRLLEIAKKFKMQDVPREQAYISPQDFLMRYCGCYDEYPNPNYKPMLSPFEAISWDSDISVEERLEYMNKYEQWERSTESQKTLKKFAPEKVTKSIEELSDERGMIFDGDRVYLSNFHYNKHLNYIDSMNKKGNGDGVKKH